MFEHELRDASTVKRWGIVRTHRDQNLADHSFYVAMYAGDITRICFGPGPWRDKLEVNVLRYALWHDVKEEIFTGDFPGPAKAAAIPDRETYDKAVAVWTESIFGTDESRFGLGGGWDSTVKAIIKVADEMDQVFEMSCEARMGNRNVLPHMSKALGRALTRADSLLELGVTEFNVNKLKAMITSAAHHHLNDDPRGCTVFSLPTS